MAKTYTQKKLSYKRKATTARVLVQFSNGETWSIPAQIIADDRDENYKFDKEDTVKFIRDGGLDKSGYELLDWFANNMDWCDVSEYAEKLVKPPEKFDYEGDFCNCEKKIDGEI